SLLGANWFSVKFAPKFAVWFPPLNIDFKAFTPSSVITKVCTPFAVKVCTHFSLKSSVILFRMAVLDTPSSSAISLIVLLIFNLFEQFFYRLFLYGIIFLYSLSFLLNLQTCYVLILQV